MFQLKLNEKIAISMYEEAIARYWNSCVCVLFVQRYE